jgi:hypothetical protein
MGVHFTPTQCATPLYGSPEFPFNSLGSNRKTVAVVQIMVIGGDLAYPNPSNETYETRFFRPYEAAFPPPPHVHSGRLVVTKPDLPMPSTLSRPCQEGPNTCPSHAELAVHSGTAVCR